MADETFTYSADFSDVHRELDDIRGRMQSFSSGAAFGVAAVGAALAFDAITTAIGSAVDAAKDWVAAAAEAQQVDARLGLAIRSAGEEVGFTQEQLEDLAVSLQRVS